MPYIDADRQREYQRVWRAKRRSEYIEKFGGVCQDCGSTDHLEFDHVDRTTKITHKFWSFSVEKIEAELKKCRLLCRKCHRIKTEAERGYGQREHGTNLEYTKYKCRCQPCRDAHAKVNAKYRQTG